MSGSTKRDELRDSFSSTLMQADYLCDVTESNRSKPDNGAEKSPNQQTFTYETEVAKYQCMYLYFDKVGAK